MKQFIKTDDAPQAIGCYSQAVRVNDTVYLSGQIPLDPATGECVAGDFSERCRQVFRHCAAIAKAAGGDLQQVVKLNVYLTDMNNFAMVNEVMAEFFSEPYPARACVAVQALPKQVDIEIDAILLIE